MAHAEDITDKLRKSDWYVADAPLAEGQKMVREHHYAKGGSNTCVYMHGLYNRATGKLQGVAWWLPPTRVACESVNKEEWRKVLSLTRFVLLPGTPKNAASFLLSRSVKMIRREGRFVSLVTYADDAMGHTGHIYKVSGWSFAGKTGPYPRWEDSDGRQIAVKSTKNRRKDEMLALGYAKVGSFYKYKFVKHLGKPPMKGVLT